MVTRREALRSLGAAGTVAVAGCGGGGSNGESRAVPVGESYTLDGLDITVEEVTTETEISLVAEEEERESDNPQTTVDSAGDGWMYVVVSVRFENNSEEEQGLPQPGETTPPAAAGEMYVTGPIRNASVVFPDGDLYRDGEAYDGLGELVADHEWTLAPGESLSGWMLFRASQELDVADLFLTVDFYGEATGNTRRFALG